MNRSYVFLNLFYISWYWHVNIVKITNNYLNRLIYRRLQKDLIWRKYIFNFLRDYFVIICANNDYIIILNWMIYLIDLFRPCMWVWHMRFCGLFSICSQEISIYFMDNQNINNEANAGWNIWIGPNWSVITNCWCYSIL